jgi:hypothetical protein
LHNKTINNLSAEPAVDLPPLVFPQSSGEDDKPQRQGEELPPSAFPEDLGNKSLAGYGGSSFSDKGAITNTNKTAVSVPKETPARKVASEVPDLLSSNTYNRTVYEDGTDSPIENDTIRVTGPNVINNDKTHEEDVTAPSIGKKENERNEKNVSVTGTSALSSLNASEGTFSNNQDVSTTHDKHSASTVTESNVASTEEFIQNGNITEITQNERNGTVLVDTFTTIPVTEGNTAVKDPNENYSISDNKEKKIKTKSDNRTNKSEPTSTTGSNTTIKNQSTDIPESDTTIKDKPAIRTESNTTIGNEPTTSNDTTTAVNSETAAQPESVSTIKESPVTQTTSAQPVQQSADAALQPTLKIQSVTPLNPSDNSSHQTVDDKPLSLAASQQHADHSHTTSGKSSAFLQPTESAAILAGVFVGIALLGYVGLLIWRRVLE